MEAFKAGTGFLPSPICDHPSEWPIYGRGGAWQIAANNTTNTTSPSIMWQGTTSGATYTNASKSLT